MLNFACDVNFNLEKIRQRLITLPPTLAEKGRLPTLPLATLANVAAEPSGF